MTVWYDTTAVFGDGDVVLRTVVVTACVHVVLRGAAVCQWCCTNRRTHGGHHCSLEESQDNNPTLTKTDPLQHQENGGGNKDSENNLLEVIKKEQWCPEDSSSFIPSGEDHHVSSENVSSMSSLCEPPSVLKETWDCQHSLNEDVRSSLVIIKMEPVEQELSPNGNHPEMLHLPAVCKAEPCPAYSDDEPQEVCGREESESSEPPPSTVEHQEDMYTLTEDVPSTLSIIKMEPDELELSFSDEHHVLHKLVEVSDLPTICKPEPGSVEMPYSGYMVAESQHEISEAEENRDLNTSEECSHLSSEDHKGLRSYPCTECGRTFSQSSSLYRHMRMHTGERPFQCSQCDKTFIQSNAFKNHQRIHTGEKPYPCSDCGKNFRRMDSLRIHQRAHTGEKPYKCSHCPKTFTRLDILQNHERIHTGEKPYQCPHCSKTFTRSSVYQVHQRTHTGERPYKCLLCGKQFLDLSNLRNHERTHTKKRPPHHCSDQ
ncbi:hypothetical protein NFI96_020596 [Prochilodus magdalenae]|nr:hypothetical protein NFI96_020596 [Prochilodus magdalenae]